MNRTKSRELAFKLIYEKEIQKEIEEENLELFFEANEIEEETVKEYLKDILFGVSKNEEKINYIFCTCTFDNYCFIYRLPKILYKYGLEL